MNTVADELDAIDRERGVEPPQPKVVEPFTPATLPGTPELSPPGIYFGMPEDEYHALPALSSHGIKSLAASPMLFWANCTWLSERARKREADRAAKADEKAYRTIGKAYHCRLLEGAEEYAKRFAVELSAEECEGALESTDQIKGAIRAAGEKPISKVPDWLPDGQAYERSAVKDDWIAQLLEIDPQAKVLARLRAEHAKANAGKQFVSFEAHEQIEIAAAMIEGDEANRHAVRGGYPEVTLIWYCAETGIPMKARCDRLKLKAIVDLKSIGNQRGLPIQTAIRYAIASYSYNVQPSVYVEGAQAVRTAVRELGRMAVWEDNGSGPNGAPANALVDWAVKWCKETDEPEWWWLFQSSGIAPITRLVQYPLQGVTRSVTDELIRQAKRKFRECSEAYGTDPWIDAAKPYMIDDEAIPPSATENLRSE